MIDRSRSSNVLSSNHMHQFSSSGIDYGGTNNQNHLNPPPPVLLYSSSANGTQRSSMSSAHTAGVPKQRQYSPLRNPPELFQPATLREGPHASRQLQPTLLLNSGTHHRASAGSINRVSLERERERERSQAEEQRRRSLEDERRVGEERRRASYDTDGPGDQRRRYETIYNSTYDNMTGNQ